MKKLLTLIIGLVLMTQVLNAQTSIDDKAYIDVIGHAERKVVPDEIYLNITIKEREAGRDKISVEEQEDLLRKALEELNIPLELLTVSDAQADYIRVKWNKKDVVSQSEYELKLATAKQVAAVMEKLDEMKIHDAYISRVDHSKIEEFQEELEIEAIQNAKAKADYLLEAIGEETGKALIVNEQSSIAPLYGMADRTTNGGYAQIMQRVELGNASKPKAAIVFKKIELESRMYVKFEIK